jgi:hypothetical protein
MTSFQQLAAQFNRATGTPTGTFGRLYARYTAWVEAGRPPKPGTTGLLFTRLFSSGITAPVVSLPSASSVIISSSVLPSYMGGAGGAGGDILGGGWLDSDEPIEEVPVASLTMQAVGFEESSANGLLSELGVYNTKPYYRATGGLYYYWGDEYWYCSTNLGAVGFDSSIVYFKPLGDDLVAGSWTLCPEVEGPYSSGTVELL